MEIELWIPYEREGDPFFDLDEFLDELDDNIRSVDLLDQAAKIRLSEAAAVTKSDLGVGLSMKTQDGYTVPDAKITRAVAKERAETSPDPENDLDITRYTRHMVQMKRGSKHLHEPS
ncbi:hypothetical protein ACOZ4L_15680 (plasmid) [Haloplanus ruber]|uniref:Uncharacterized protein n=1 Tax=Haloplanus ruber TaxID=869892 RepID=A0ABD6CXX7_9EURY|nr:hypothetical protein [Haloplanus ruber]